MKSQFVSYEIALALKELGFDEPCIKYMQGNSFDVNSTSVNECVPVLAENFNVKQDCVSIPLYQQVEQWFREKHQIIIAVYAYHDLDAIDEVDQILWEFTLWDKEWNDVSDYTYYHSYEEARDAAILEAIKIVKGEIK